MSAEPASGRFEHGEVLVSGPLEVVAQVAAVRLECAAAVPSQEPGRGDLGFVGRLLWIVGAECGSAGESAPQITIRIRARVTSQWPTP